MFICELLESKWLKVVGVVAGTGRKYSDWSLDRGVWPVRAGHSVATGSTSEVKEIQEHVT